MKKLFFGLCFIITTACISGSNLAIADEPMSILSPDEQSIADISYSAGRGDNTRLTQVIRTGISNGLSVSTISGLLARQGQDEKQITATIESAGQVYPVKEPPKTFAPGDQVRMQKVYYKNRYNIMIAGDMYMLVSMDMKSKHPALIVGGPYGAVKEQPSGLYAQEMAKHGLCHAGIRLFLQR